MEIPFVFEVKLLNWQTPLAWSAFFFFNHGGLFVGFRKSIKAAAQPQDKN